MELIAFLKSSVTPVFHASGSNHQITIQKVKKKKLNLWSLIMKYWVHLCYLSLLVFRSFVCIVLVVSFCISFNRKFLLNLELVTLNWVIKSWYLKGYFVIIFIHDFSDVLGNSWFIQISVFYKLTDIGLNPLLILLHSKHVSLSIKAMQIQQ